MNIRVPPLKKNTDYGSELLIPKNPKQSLLFSVSINLSKQDFFHLMIKVTIFIVSPISDRLNVCLYSEDQLDIIGRALVEYQIGEKERGKL